MPRTYAPLAYQKRRCSNCHYFRPDSECCLPTPNTAPSVATIDEDPDEVVCDSHSWGEE